MAGKRNPNRIREFEELPLAIVPVYGRPSKRMIEAFDAEAARV